MLTRRSRTRSSRDDLRLVLGALLDQRERLVHEVRHLRGELRDRFARLRFVVEPDLANMQRMLDAIEENAARVAGEAELHVEDHSCAG